MSDPIYRYDRDGASMYERHLFALLHQTGVLQRVEPDYLVDIVKHDLSHSLVGVIGVPPTGRYALIPVAALEVDDE